MEAGKLRHRLQFQQQTIGQDPETGEPMPGDWGLFAKVWGAVEPLSSRDLVAAQAAQSTATKRIIIRYRSGILPTMRILHRGEIYDIVGPPLEDKKSGLDYLTMLVSTGLNDG